MTWGSCPKIETKIPFTRTGQFIAVGKFLKKWPVEKGVRVRWVVSTLLFQFTEHWSVYAHKSQPD
jgi:hypothetical protein